MGKNILVVDDEVVSRELVKRRLAENGFEINTAQDGLEALSAVQKARPDLILLDIQMPKMNGYAFIGELRKYENEQQPPIGRIPVIVLTAHDKMEPIFKRHGARGYVLKPLDMDKLLLMIKDVLK